MLAVLVLGVLCISNDIGISNGIGISICAAIGFRHRNRIRPVW